MDQNVSNIERVFQQQDNDISLFSNFIYNTPKKVTITTNKMIFRVIYYMTSYFYYYLALIPILYIY